MINTQGGVFRYGRDLRLYGSICVHAGRNSYTSDCWNLAGLSLPGLPGSMPSHFRLFVVEGLDLVVESLESSCGFEARNALGRVVRLARGARQNSFNQLKFPVGEGSQESSARLASDSFGCHWSFFII